MLEKYVSSLLIIEHCGSENHQNLCFSKNSETNISNKIFRISRRDVYWVLVVVSERVKSTIDIIITNNCMESVNSLIQIIESMHVV